MGRKKDPRFNISPSFICKKCGYATITEEQPQYCEKCRHTYFDKLLIQANWETRQPFNTDKRQVSPI